MDKSKRFFGIKNQLSCYIETRKLGDFISK